MNLDPLRRALEPTLRRVLHFYWRFARGLTLGVRAVVIDREGRVFLVKHSYVAGWHLPGGGVEPGETVLDALTRELMEEGGISLLAPPALHGIFFNTRDSRRDHVMVYVVRVHAGRRAAPPPRDHRPRLLRATHCPPRRRAGRAGSPKCWAARPCPRAGERRNAPAFPCAPPGWQHGAGNDIRRES